MMTTRTSPRLSETLSPWCRSRTSDMPRQRTRLRRILTAGGARDGHRRGAALVEMALVLPLMILVVLGMFELGRGVMVTEVLAHAARAGARTGAISTGTTQLARDAVLTVLNDARIQGATVQVLVNGSATEVGNAKSGDQIQVIVTVPYANVSWIANPEYLKDRNLSGRCIMRRE